MATGRIGVTPVLRTRWSDQPTAGTTSLSGLDDNSVALVYDAGYEAVYRNGVLLSRGNDYTATDGTTITLIDATLAGDIIEVFANDLVPLTDAISKGQYNAKGALLSASAAATPGVVAVGANGTVLTADSAEVTGLKWAAPAGGASFTQLASTALSGTTTTISGLSGYNTLWISWIAAGTNTANASVDLRFNGDTTDKYRTVGFTLRNADAANTTNMEGLASDSSRIFVGNQGNSAGNNFSGGLILYGANTTATKVGQMFNGSTGQGAVARDGNILYSGTSVISSVSLISSGTFDEGTILILGSVN